MIRKDQRFNRMYIIILAALTFAAPARADVTVDQKMTLDVASMIRMHGTTTLSIAADKQRNDVESHCEGMMSLLCGNLRSGEIIRLDKGLTWNLEPAKNRYREEQFATPEQLSQMRAKMQANLEKMRACPVPSGQPDQSKCTMSAPKIDVKKTDEKATIAGHEAQRTLATLTQSCTDKQTGDVCDTVIAMDVWLTQDTLPGATDRETFQRAYAKKLGLDDADGVMRGAAIKFLAPYQAQMKQLAAKSSDLKGQPLSTSFRMLFGGPQCGAATKMQQSNSSGGNIMGDAGQAGVDAGVNSTQGVANGAAQDAISRVTGTSIGGAIASSAVGASVGKLMGGLFGKKKSASPAVDSVAPVADKDPFPKLVQMARFTVETVSIKTDPLPADHFEVPADWKKVTPKASKGGDEEFVCPKSGG